MSHARFESEDELRRAVTRELDAGPVPAQAQAKLDDVYASLGSIPQDRPDASGATAPTGHKPVRRHDATGAHGARSGSRTARRGAVVAVAAVLVVLLSGVAFAATSLLQMKPGEALFFDGGKNLPIYGSLQEGVSSLSAEAGETVDVEGVRVTLDSVSSDRNIVNLFFTLEKEGGFDLDEQASYVGSQESDWTRLQRLVPRFSYDIASAGESVASGSLNLLDAYVEDGKVKIMQRIVPESTLPDQVDIALEGWSSWKPYEEGFQPFTMHVGLDLSTVSQPRELGAQDLVFATSEGDKTMGVKRFTASELGTVMVVRNDEVETIEESGRPIYNVAEDSITPEMLKITDDQGNVLTPVGAGDGLGVDPSGDYVVELAGLSPEATGVTFTPMLYAADWESMTQDELQTINDANERMVDVSQTGAKLETSEYGGYELMSWDVSDGTVSIALKPYGWQIPSGSIGRLVPSQQPTPLYEERFDEGTGEKYWGYHTAIAYQKYDYVTGELLLMTSYYAASDEELLGLRDYEYQATFGEYREEGDAAQTLSF